MNVIVTLNEDIILTLTIPKTKLKETFRRCVQVQVVWTYGPICVLLCHEPNLELGITT